MTRQQQYARQWYAKNRDEQRAKARVRTNRYHDLNMRLRSLILSAQPCADCGEPPDPMTPFEFDHRVGIGSSAQHRISDLVTKGSSHVRMLREMQKCDVVCPTCHKERTYRRGQWKRGAYITTLKQRETEPCQPT